MLQRQREEAMRLHASSMPDGFLMHAPRRFQTAGAVYADVDRLLRGAIVTVLPMKSAMSRMPATIFRHERPARREETKRGTEAARLWHERRFTVRAEKEKRR